MIVETMTEPSDPLSAAPAASENTNGSADFDEPTRPVPPEEEAPTGSSANAFKHGCSGTGKVMTPKDQDKADRLFAMLCDTYDPNTEYEEHLLQGVANERTLAERCQSISFTLIDEISLAAQLHWDLEQEAAAEGLATRLPKAPALVAAQLALTPQGVAVMDDRWTRLGQVLKDNGDWTDPQRSLALDLLGTPLELREKGQTDVDARLGQDQRRVAQAVVDRQLQKLRDPSTLQARRQTDTFRKDMAALGAPVRISHEMRLLKRYEAMHIRRENELMAEFERVRGEGETEAPEPRTRFEAGLAAIHPRQEEGNGAAQEAAASAAKSAAASAAQPVKLRFPQAAPAAAAPVTTNGATPKAAPKPKPLNRFQQEAAKRAKRKAEREARKAAHRQR